VLYVGVLSVLRHGESDQRSFGFLRIVDWLATFQENLLVSYSGVKQFFASLTLENWADKLSCNVRNKLST
jgi:hypothetical protein